MKWTKAKTLMAFAMLMLLTASIGGCFHPYRSRYDYDSYRRDRSHDSYNYRDRSYDGRDRDRW